VSVYSVCVCVCVFIVSVCGVHAGHQGAPPALEGDQEGQALQHCLSEQRLAAGQCQVDPHRLGPCTLPEHSHLAGAREAETHTERERERERERYVKQ